MLTVPEREGREALFGLWEIIEFLANRYLLRDGWPLATAAGIVRTTDVAGLAQLIPSERPRTRAEEVATKYRGGRAAAELSDESTTARRGKRVSAEAFALTPEAPAPSASRRAAVQQAMKLATPPLPRRGQLAPPRVARREPQGARQRRGPPRSQPPRPHRAHAVVPRARRRREARRDERRHPRHPRGRIDPDAPGRAHTRRKVTMTTPTMIITARRSALLAGRNNEFDVLVRPPIPGSGISAFGPPRQTI